MYCHHALFDHDINYRVNEFLREAENDRLVSLAMGPGRPIRRRIADWLVSVAEWVDDQPHGAFMHAEA